MKRLTALALCLTTVFTLGTSVSADTLSSTTAGSNTSNQQVNELIEMIPMQLFTAWILNGLTLILNIIREAKEHGIQLLINIQNQNRQVGEIRRVRSR